MFHLASYQFHPELLTRKLSAFVGQQWEDTRLARLDRRSKTWKSTAITGPEVIPKYGSASPDRAWITIGGKNSLDSLTGIAFDWSNHNSLEDLDRFLAIVAQNFDWALISWGTFMTDEVFLFISTSEILVQRFSRASSEQLKIPAFLRGQCKNVDVNLAMYSGRINHSILESASIASVSEEVRGQRLWDCLGADEGGVFLATVPPEWETHFGDETTAIKSMAQHGKLEVIDKLCDTTEMNDGAYWLYQIHDRDTLLELGRKMWGPVNGIDGYAVSLNVRKERAIRILRDLIQFDSINRITALRKTIKQVPWLYTAGDCHMDVSYERFATQDRGLLRRFITPHQAREFELISLY